MKLKNWAAVLLGLLIGLIVAIPVFWMGIQRGVKTMYLQAEMDFKVVESRLQTMADEAYELRKLLARLGWKGDPEVFERVEENRSWLHGRYPLAAKMDLAENLERSLLEVEAVWRNAGRRRKHIRENPYYHGWGEQWEKLMRLLVKEEKVFELAVNEYNTALNSQAFRFFYDGMDWSHLTKFAKYRITIEKETAGGTFKPITRVRTGGKSFDIDADVAGMKSGDRDYAGRTAFWDLPKPYFIAEAPMPEFDYKEVQYDRDTTIMAITDIQDFDNIATDEEPVYLNRNAPEKFKAAEDHKQKKVIY